MCSFITRWRFLFHNNAATMPASGGPASLFPSQQKWKGHQGSITWDDMCIGFSVLTWALHLTFNKSFSSFQLSLLQWRLQNASLSNLHKSPHSLRIHFLIAYSSTNSMGCWSEQKLPETAVLQITCNYADLSTTPFHCASGRKCKSYCNRNIQIP